MIDRFDEMVFEREIAELPPRRVGMLDRRAKDEKGANVILRFDQHNIIDCCARYSDLLPSQ